MAERHLVSLHVSGRPATFATAHEKAWKQAIPDAVIASGVQPHAARFAVRMDFRLGPARTANEGWDLDSLIKPTLDAMEGLFGTRPSRGLRQPADDRVDRIEATKRLPRTGERPGATIDVWLIDDTSETWGKNKAQVTAQHAPDHLLGRPGVRSIRFLLVEGNSDHTPLHPGSIHGEADRFAKLLRAWKMAVQVIHPPGPQEFGSPANLPAGTGAAAS